MMVLSSLVFPLRLSLRVPGDVRQGMPIYREPPIQIWILIGILILTPIPLWEALYITLSPYGPIGPILGPFGPIWAHLGPFGPIGPIWAHWAHWAHGPLGPWPILGPLGPLWAHWAHYYYIYIYIYII